MLIDRLQPQLRSLGVAEDQARALLSLPLIRIAWSGGAPSTAILHEVEQFCRDVLLLNAACMRLVDHWLLERPSEAYFESALVTLVRLEEAPDEVAIGEPELRRVLAEAERLARLKRREPGNNGGDSLMRSATLQRLEKRFGVDLGVTWESIDADAFHDPDPSEVEALSRLPAGHRAAPIRRLRTERRLRALEDLDTEEGGII